MLWKNGATAARRSGLIFIKRSFRDAPVHKAVLRGAEVVERLRQFPSPLLNFVEQPHIRNSDHGLVSEAGNEFHLLVTERLDLRARQKDHADHVLIAQQGNPQHRACLGVPLPAQIGDLRHFQAAKVEHDRAVGSFEGLLELFELDAAGRRQPYWTKVDTLPGAIRDLVCEEGLGLPDALRNGSSFPGPRLICPSRLMSRSPA